MVADVIFNVALLFLLMIPGIILKKCKMIPEGFGKGLSNLVLYIAQPALIFLAYIKPFDINILINSTYVLVFSVIAHSIFAVVAMLLFKGAEDGKRRMLRFATIFSNAAFMGIPLINAVLEDTYPGATLYASIYNITFNLFLWSLGVMICTKNRDKDKDGIDDHDEAKTEGASIMKALLHPVTIAAAIGLVFFVFPVTSYIPDVIWGLVSDTATHLKNLVAPLSMIVIGLRLPDISFKGMLKDKYMYLFLALRHILLPLAVVGVLRLAMLTGIEMSGAVAPVVLILASAPAASSATMFAEKYDCDATYVSRLVTVSTLLSIVTMPLLLMLI
ncbi:MAG: AEC family transporter [Clostridia bacterium]|nr:AEC family transporter [Clostridia bacterium]